MHHLHHQPPGPGPGQQKTNPRFAAPRDTDRNAGQHKQDCGKEGHGCESQIEARRQSVAFLSAGQLGSKIIAQRLFQELAVALEAGHTVTPEMDAYVRSWLARQAGLTNAGKPLR